MIETNSIIVTKNTHTHTHTQTNIKIYENKRRKNIDLVNKAKLVHNFLNMFIAFLYMFRATVCPSSVEITVSMRHLYLSLCMDECLEYRVE